MGKEVGAVDVGMRRERRADYAAGGKLAAISHLGLRVGHRALQAENTLYLH